jgi:geranylgeranyl diphosphate synthase type II
MLCYQAAGGEHPEFGVAMPAAGAIEMIHCFSLIHDDLPAMDDDDLRRGRATNHKVHGEGMAILAGDGLNTLPFELIASRVTTAPLAVSLVKELAHATGVEGMIGGQVLDTMHPESLKATGAKGTLEDLQRIHRMKTGALIKCACRMGALCANPQAGVVEHIDTYGKAIGLAFQIVDDILDVTATEEQMGKKTGKDAAIGKLTYPSLVGLDKAREYLAGQVRIADEVAKNLGPHAVLLSELAHELAGRTN